MLIQHSKTSVLNPRINLLHKKDNLRPRGHHVFRVSKFIVYLLVILLLALTVFSYQMIFTDNSVTQIFDKKINIFQQLGLLTGNNNLKGAAQDRINILLLGIGGAGHDGPNLTDTIILASVQPSTKKIALLSLPRDLLVNIPDRSEQKINEVYAWGEQSIINSGGRLTEQTLAPLLGIPVHYYIRLDFSGFAKIIDELGGVKVNVERGFTDAQYPTEDYKYQIVSFNAGWQTMDGDTALKFTRSRHGNNGEGSDFARSQRQQKILAAIKERSLSYNNLLNPNKLNKLFKELAAHLKTDLEPWEIIKLANLLGQADTSQIKTQVLDDGPSGYLYADNVNGAYVLKPVGDNFSAIQQLTKNLLTETPVATPVAKAVETQRWRIEIRNGTTIPGLASGQSDALTKAGFEVIKLGNAPDQTQTQTKIYKLRSDASVEGLDFLRQKYQTAIIASTIPDWIQQEVAPDMDFFIVLGADAAPK